MKTCVVIGIECDGVEEVRRSRLSDLTRMRGFPKEYIVVNMVEYIHESDREVDPERIGPKQW